MRMGFGSFRGKVALSAFPLGSLSFSTLPSRSLRALFWLDLGGR